MFSILVMFCLLLGNLLLWVAIIESYSIMEQVNRAVPSENRIRRIFLSWRLFEVLAVHRGLYPHSRKRKRMGWCVFGAFALTLVGAVIWDHH
jgi:hypothetical protein